MLFFTKFFFKTEKKKKRKENLRSDLYFWHSVTHAQKHLDTTKYKKNWRRKINSVPSGPSNKLEVQAVRIWSWVGSVCLGRDSFRLGFPGGILLCKWVFIRPKMNSSRFACKLILSYGTNTTKKSPLRVVYL